MAGFRRLGALAATALAAACSPDLPTAPQVAGAACSPSSAAAFAALREPLKSAEFNGMTFQRDGGHVSCKGYKNDALICWMSAPNFLHVRHQGRDWWWRPGAGQRVILAVNDGAPRCMLDVRQTVGEWAGKHMGVSCEASGLREC